MERQVSHSVANFAAKFCKELGVFKTSICSPLSAEMVLALLALGCKNQTREELLKALDVTDSEDIRSSYGYITSTLKTIKGATLNIANKVYLKKGKELKPGIEKDAKKVFQSSLGQLDFEDNEAAANKINNWVAQQTNDMITDIISPNAINEDTRVVLVNAIYFQGLWVNQFEPSETAHRPFHVNIETTIQVPMMSLTETYFDYGVSRELKAKLLRMKYQGDEASMVIVLPDEVEGLRFVLRKLASGHNIMSEIETMRSEELNIMIPKFKVETTIDLKQMLPKLGIKSIFDEKNADIDFLQSNQKLFVSHAIQKAVIIVDEYGTEAAACTECDDIELCDNDPIRFDADRPFLYLLIAREILLFIGIYRGSEYSQSTASTHKRKRFA